MELQEALIEPFRLKLASRLQNRTDVTKGKHGWMWMDQDGVVWYEAAKIALEELEHLSKATATCFAIARRICHEHGLRKEPCDQLKIGGYCLEQMVLADWCWIEWHPEKKSHVVMVRDETLRKSPRLNTYTSFKPFESWTAPYSPDGKQLIKPSQWTVWEPPDWHFSGKAPLPGERRTWHPFMERMFTVDDGTPSGSLMTMGHPKEYKDQDWPVLWVNAINKLERNRYRINQPMLELIHKLDKHFPKGYVDNSTLKIKKPTGKKKRLKEEREKFDLLVREADRLLEGGTFYQRCHLDHRGRIYLSRSTLSYQGDDLERSLVEFADGVELDDVFVPCIDILKHDGVVKQYPVSEGFKWLLLHAANLYEAPGIGADDRIDYAITHLDEWINYANNPLDTVLDWHCNDDGELLDDPLQFIRACMELRDAVEHEAIQQTKKPKKLTKKRMDALKEELIATDRDTMQVIREITDIPQPFISHIGVEQDQTNSVIQHLAMIYGSETLAAKANLIEPTDFYNLVAEEWERITDPSYRELKKYTLTHGERRKIVKKIVVPRCYGAGDESIADQISGLPIRQLQEAEEADLIALADEGIRLLERRNIAPEVAQFRLEVGRMLRGLNLQASDSVDWSMPSGFEVHLRPEYVGRCVYHISDTAEKPFVRSELIARPRTGRLKVKKVLTSGCAAIIHSIDGCLAQMMLTGNDFPIITTHDAFTCHAANVGKLREQFVQKLADLHQIFQPYAVIQRDVSGAVLTGLLADPEIEQRAMAILHLALQVQEYPESIG